MSFLWKVCSEKEEDLITHFLVQFEVMQGILAACSHRTHMLASKTAGRWLLD
jgi:hypothetical protein